MAKSDFDIDETEYDVVYDDVKKQKKSKKSKKFSDSSAADQAIISNLSSNNTNNNLSDDLGDFTGNIVYDDAKKTSISDWFQSINIRVLVVIGGIFLVIFVVAFLIIHSVIKASNAYSSETIIPDIVYMGETSNMYVATKYSGRGNPKKDINNTENLFESADSNVLYILNDNVKGSSALNTIIPVQEGRTTVSIVSKLDGKTIGKREKEVVVCPAFDASMVPLKIISVNRGSRYDLKIDFGEEECAKGVTYSIKDKSIATVDETGAIEGIAVGKTILTIGRGTKSVSMTIVVTDDYVSLQSFKVNSLDVQLAPSEKYRLNTDYAPINATSFIVSYYSQNSDIASVSAGGLITALSVGSTTIKVTTPSFMGDVLVNVTVKDNQSTDFPTNMVLDRSKLNLVQGNSQKINATFTPNTVSKDVIKWSSSNEEIVGVTPKGVIYAKGVGKAIVTAATNNGISRDVEVNVEKIKSPTIVVSDGIKSGNWHTKPFVMTFLGSDSGTVYFYGDSTSNMKNVSNKLTISNNENKTYYVKACTRVCEEVCDSEKEDTDEVTKSCKTVCSEEPSVCSDSVTYVSKLDRTKPVITTVVGIDTVPAKSDTVQIAVSDTTSLVNKWCVTDGNSYGKCRWKKIEPSSNPVLEYTALKNGTYYAFVKDVAGNISNSYEFQITSIE